MGKASKKKKAINKAAGNKIADSAAEIKSIPSRKAAFILIIIIFTVSFSVYFSALFDGFVYDDSIQILKNPWIKNVNNIPDIFLKSVWSFQKDPVISNYYRPLMHIIYMFDYHIFGFKPWGFHLMNILFHSGVSILVFFVSLMLLKEAHLPNRSSLLLPSFLAALLFAVHPIHTEAVTWVAGLPEISFTFFYLLSLYFYFLSQGKLNGAYLFSLLSFSLALFFKEPALTLPIILAIYDYIFRKKDKLFVDHVKGYIPYIVITAGYLLLRLHALGGLAPQPSHIPLSLDGYIINIFPLFMQYMEKLLLPINLNAFYVFHPVTSLLEPKGFAALIVAAAFVILSLIFLKRNKFVFFCLMVVAVPLLPVLYIPGLGENTFTERYLYLPSLGFVILLAAFITRGLARFSKGAIAGAVVCISLVGAYSIGTVSRNSIWKDNYSLFADTVKKSPDGAIPRANLGSAYYDKGLIDMAIEQYQVALKLKPDTVEIHNNLGIAYNKKGLIDNAIEEHEIAAKLNPDSAEVHNNLGIAYGKKGLIDKSIEQYLVALKLNPDYAEARINMGNAYVAKGMTDKAAEQYRTVSDLNPNAESHYNQGNLYVVKGMADKAIEQYRIAVKLNPDYTEAHYNLANTYVRKGSIDEAIKEYRMVLKLKPDYIKAYDNLGVAFMNKGLVDKAIEQYQAALRLKADHAEAYNNLGIAYGKKGLIDKSIEQYQIAIKLSPEYIEAHYNLGNAYVRKGLTDNAIEKYQTVLKLHPGVAEAHYNLAMLYKKKGLKVEAKKELEAALQIRNSNAKTR